MTTLAERLTSIMSEKGLSQAELARMTGLKQPSVFKIVSGQTLNPKNIVEIATALGVDVNWLKTGEGEPIAQGSIISSLVSTDSDEHHRFRVDYLDVQAAAGHSGIENADYPEVIQSIYFSKEGLLEIVGKSTNDGISLINVPTDSMVPTINKGDIVFVDTKVNYYTGEGVYFFLLNGGAYIKRLMKLPTGVYRAISDNSVYPDFDISDELFDTAVIIGKFIKVLPINPKDL
ncbi:XRE family transcriptional regulator [Haemophilus haemolyticus]|jgi:transcriptional activator-regulatory protein|uniref:XRE family transcriptional regulator n=1 Tax=Haemophilus haemolyticus TaxID=726 RepID=UPI0011287746|nr:helix-turn-helix transcriptional regulator [Haemophilus haemolyticus]TPH24122.1 XRE family transcriptional regulator [Haemophilus haemolyticus]DAJ68622.1 MAG TPA: Repressor protein CI [Caudoviricetes sp.]